MTNFTKHKQYLEKKIYIRRQMLKICYKNLKDCKKTVKANNDFAKFTKNYKDEMVKKRAFLCKSYKVIDKMHKKW